MLEVEVKYPVKDWDAVQRQLHAWGASCEEAREEIDQYFNAPDRDFAQTDEALRMRRVALAASCQWHTLSNFVTYKGPKTDTQTKTRTEIEVPLAPGAAVA